jgi:hypothetical protein
LIDVMTPRPAHPTPGSGPPDSTHLMLQVLDGAGSGGEAQHGVLRFGVKDQARRIRLWVAPDDEDLLIELDQRGERVLGGRRLADPSFAVKRNLTELAHGDVPCAAVGV